MERREREALDAPSSELMALAALLPTQETCFCVPASERARFLVGAHRVPTLVPQILEKTLRGQRRG